MNNRLMQINIDSFIPLLAGYKNLGIDMENCIDGGAGIGDLSRAMLPYLSPKGKIFAFEPFPGNFQFIDKSSNEQIRVIKKALYSENSTKKFFTSSIVKEGDRWDQERGLAGYSSLGYLVDTVSEEMTPNTIYDVPCLRADDAIRPERRISFVKLDLQGGELEALKGMARILGEAYFLWIEFSDQPGLLDFLYESGFIVFETPYLFLGDAYAQAQKDFEFIRSIELSTGHPAWFGRRKRPWGKDFHAELRDCKANYRLIQTDIVCVHQLKYHYFNNALDAMRIMQ